MEWIDGLRCTDPEAIKASGINVDGFIRCGVVGAWAGAWCLGCCGRRCRSCYSSCSCYCYCCWLMLAAMMALLLNGAASSDDAQGPHSILHSGAPLSAACSLCCLAPQSTATAHLPGLPTPVQP